MLILSKAKIRSFFSFFSSLFHILDQKKKWQRFLFITVICCPVGNLIFFTIMQLNSVKILKGWTCCLVMRQFSSLPKTYFHLLKKRTKQWHAFSSTWVTNVKKKQAPGISERKPGKLHVFCKIFMKISREKYMEASKSYQLHFLRWIRAFSRKYIKQIFLHPFPSVFKQELPERCMLHKPDIRVQLMSITFTFPRSSEVHHFYTALQ